MDTLHNRVRTINSILISPGALHGNCTVALSLWVSIARTSSSDGTHRQGGCNGKCLAYSAFSTGNCFMSLTYTQAKRTSFICSDEAAKRTMASETYTQMCTDAVQRTYASIDR